MVMNAEVEDLNFDGSPELIVFTRSNTSNLRGNVYAFSVNNKKYMSMVYFQPTEGNQQINKGYKGNDEFATVKTSLVQRFPLYENDKESGKMRQIQYSLEDGEASRKFKVKKITEFEMP